MSNAIDSAPVHGRDGWDLITFDWDERTGEEILMYVRKTDQFVMDGRHMRQVTERREVRRQGMVPARKPVSDSVSA